MTDQPQQTKPNDHRYYPEDEIGLIDYLLVIWKWKNLIIAGTLAITLVAGIISFIAWKQQPTMYRTSTTMRIIREDLKNVKALIENDLKQKVRNYIKSSNNPNLSNALDFQVRVIEGNDTINVSLGSALADEDTTKLHYLIKTLTAELDNKRKYIQKGFDENIEAKKREIEKLKEKEIISRKNIIERKKYELDELSFKEEIMKNKIEKYQPELLEIESKMKLLQESKDNSQSKEYLLNKLSIENDYRSTFHKYFELNENARYNLFKIQKGIIKVTKGIETLEKGKYNIQNDSNYKKRISEIQKGIAENSKEIKKLELEKEKLNVQNIWNIQPPVTNEIPKTIKIKRNVVLSLVTGLFLMLVLSFFLEYISKFKDRKSR